ncbi:hypothetical protein RD110_12810 [Rhodoferax koreense]|uniref:Uncharacterized protein n=1 Tax=Rhodoferax koreensis TaxID=1842727 RepID=A0A1P8JW45_9BURK|nr:hypothetical protein RD110_12810 [Rhodoferax koreense]
MVQDAGTGGAGGTGGTGGTGAVAPAGMGRGGWARPGPRGLPGAGGSRPGPANSSRMVSAELPMAVASSALPWGVRLPQPRAQTLLPTCRPGTRPAPRCGAKRTMLPLSSSTPFASPRSV